jgi:DNA polymerase III delta prime subunit
LDWLSNILDVRMRTYFQDAPFDLSEFPPPNLDHDSNYRRLTERHDMTPEDRIILAMALVPHVCPQLYDRFYIQNKSIARGFSEFGGIESTQHRGFIPTGETVCFVIAGRDIRKRVELLSKFREEFFFRRYNILSLYHSGVPETFWSGKLSISDEYLTYLTTGETYDPVYSLTFPASKLSTTLRMDDLVLSPEILDEVGHIMTWMDHQQTLRSDELLRRHFRKGYRALFHGPPGTGKTLTVSILGSQSGRKVYRIDLSQLVSKYIGETEKNLAGVFDMAENKDWILFFDEAESLFSKRTDVSDSKDRYANQETSYLLQRLENFDGLVILATNLKPNIDRAFIRRFQSIIHFTMPDERERQRLWANILAPFALAGDVDHRELAQRFEISGGAISNAVQFAWLSSRSRKDHLIRSSDLTHGVVRELGKEGKTSRS